MILLHEYSFSAHTLPYFCPEYETQYNSFIYLQPNLKNLNISLLQQTPTAYAERELQINYSPYLYLLWKI